MHKITIPFLEGRREEFFLGIGEVAFAVKPCLIRTVLGSCVGVSLFDRLLGLGGMCHYLLDRAPEGQTSTRYGDVAINSLVRRFLASGSRPGQIEACVAGGGLILDMSQVFFVGERNARMADETLARLGIRVSRREVGGNRGRRMSLDSGSGEVGIEFIPEFDSERFSAI